MKGKAGETKPPRRQTPNIVYIGSNSLPKGKKAEIRPWVDQTNQVDRPIILCMLLPPVRYGMASRLHIMMHIISIIMLTGVRLHGNPRSLNRDTCNLEIKKIYSV